MSSPIGGENLGTARGIVRIDYQSSGVAQATKNLENLQGSLESAGKSSAGLEKQAGAAQAQMNRFASQIKQVQSQVSQYAKATEAAQKRVEAMQRRGVTGPRLVNAKGLAAQTKADLDRTKALLNDWQRFVSTRRTTLPAPRVDQGGVRSAVQRLKQVVATEMTRGFASGGGIAGTGFDLSKLLGGAKGLGSQGLSMGKMLGGGIASGLRAAGPIIAVAGKAALAGVTAVATTAVAAIGYTLTKGFQRLEGLDQAAMKLKALGYNTAQIEAISKSALESVQDTAFGLDEAFNTAAAAVASGIKPGEELTNYLKTVADNAAIAGTSMQEMGFIFGKVMTQGKVMGGELDLFTERNIDIIGNLSDELGVSRNRVADLASESQISSEVFLRAMSRNAGAAKTMGQTISGSFNNLRASISRLGAGLLAPLFGKANGEASGFAKAIQAVTNRLKQVEEWLSNNKDRVVDWWAAAGKGAITFAKVTVEALAAVIDVVGGLTMIIGDLTGGLLNAWVEVQRALGRDVENLDNVANTLFGLGEGTKEWSGRVRQLIPWLDKGYPLIDKWADSTKRQLAATSESAEFADEAGQSYQTLGDQLEELGVKTDTVTKAIEGSLEQFDELIKTLREKGATQQMIDQITTLRNRFDSGGRAAKSYADAIRNMKDQTIEASAKADALVESLKDLGLLPDSDALDAYEDAFRDLGKYNAELADQLDVTGQALINLDGTFNTSYENANRLKDQFEQVRDAAFELAASGRVAPGDVYDETSRRLTYLLEQYGITGDAARQFIEQNLVGGRAQFEAQFTGDPVAALQQTIKDPVQLESMLNLLTTHQDIINQVTGGTGKVQIPAELIGPDGQPLNVPGAGGPGLPPPPSAPPPGMPAVPGQGLHWEDGKGWVPDEGVEPPKPLPERVAEARKRWEEANKPPPPEPDKPWWQDIIDALNPGTVGQGGLQFTWPGSDDPVPQTPLEQKELDALKDQALVKEIMAQDYELMYYLQNRQQEYEAQGKTLADAYAEGILSGDEEIRNAIKKLAQIAADGLGHSPAKYGPLSGRGWTYFRGQDFTRSWAEGIASEADTAQSAVAGTAQAAVMPFGDQVEQMIGDFQQLSDFGKLALDFANQIAGIGFSVAKLANDLSGGRLFPKTYTPDPNAKTPGSALSPWRPNMLPTPGSAQAAGALPFTQPAAGNAAPGAGLQGDAVTYTVDYLRKAGWAPLFGPDGQLPAIVNQALGQLNVRAQTPDFHGSLHGNPGGVGYAIDVAGDLAQQEKLAQMIMDNPQLRSQVAQLIFQGPSGRRYGIAGGEDVSNTSYYATQWAAHMDHVHLAAQQSVFAAIAQGLGLSPGALDRGAPSPTASSSTSGSGAASGRPLAQAVTGKQLIPIGNGFFHERGGKSPFGSAVFRKIGGKYYNVADIAIGPNGQPELDSSGVPFANRPVTTTKPQTTTATTATATLGANPSQQDIANYIYGRALQEGFSDSQARDFVVQAFGESGLNPRASNPAGWEGIFQFDRPTWQQAGGGDMHNAQQNIDNYFRLARQRGLTPQTMTSGVQLGTQVSIGGPWHPENQAKGHLTNARAGAAPFLAALSPSTGLPVNVTQMTDSVTRPLQGVFDNTSSLPTIPSGLEQYRDLLANRPQSQEEAVSWLQRIDGAIADQNRLGTPQSQQAAERLGAMRSQTMSSFGLQEGPSMLEQAEDIFNGISGIASSVFETFDAGLKYIGAWKTVGDVLVRGIANTQDIMTLVDQWQIGLDFWNKLIQTGSQIASFAGQFTGGQDMGITSAVGGVLGIVSQVMTAINTGIDMWQEAYKITTKYLGRFLTSWLGFPGATDMRFLLDEVTGQVQAYTSENPRNKHTFNTLPRALGKQYPERQAPTNNLYIYQGPGQDPRDTMDDAMFTIRQSGVGAFGYGTSTDQGF